MGRGLKNALESLSKTLASRANRDGINVLERTDCTVLVEKRVPPVGWLSGQSSLPLLPACEFRR